MSATAGYAIETAADHVADRRELQRDAIVVLAIMTGAAGACIMLIAHVFPDPWHGVALALLLMLAAPLAAFLLDRDYEAGAGLLLGTWLTAGVACVFWFGASSTRCLLALPVGFAVLFLNLRAGFATGIAVSLVLALVPPSGGLVPELALMWVIFVMLYLSARQTDTAVLWMWQAYEHAREQLEVARGRQVELRQAVKDLADANVQMARLNELLAIAQRTAEDAERVKAEFVANVSHELRTPLNMIVGFAEMIMQAPQTYRAPLPQALLADLSVIHRNCEQLASLIDDVLDLSQVQAGQMALARERVDLAGIIEAATVAVRPLFDSKGLYLKVEGRVHLPIFCDPTRIREVVLNLLSNAGRFTATGGVTVRTQVDKGSVVVSLSDTGPGIAASMMDRLFRPFEQLDGSIRRRYGGSGLGLAISKSFVDLHGGALWAESTVGVGTTFFFRLPIDPPATPVRSPASWLNPDWEFRQRTERTSAPHPVVQPRLVVWEPGHTLARILGRYSEGREIKSVASLESAVAECGRGPVQAIVINDTSLPRALQVVQAAPALPPDTPVILCALPEAQDAAHSLGASDYLVKPVSQSRLLDAIDRLAQPVRTVLVVDDEPDASRLFLRMLASTGRKYRTLRASDGQEALEVMRRRQPDLVLLDLAMPNLDGFRLLQVKREDPALRNIPVLVLSARDPSGQPLVTGGMAVTLAGGLSIAQLVTCIEGITQTLSPAARSAHRAQPAGSPG